MKITLHYPPGSDVPVIPTSCNHDAFLVALDDRNYEKMHHMFKVVSETASVLSDALAVLYRERQLTKPTKLDTREDFPVYVMTSGGRLWKNAHILHRNGKKYRQCCGWQEFDKNGKHIGEPIGHTQFRKLKKAKKTGNRHRDHWLRLCRPEGPWRRHIDCILNHSLFGNGKVIMTDGLHALFEYHTVEGDTKRVEVTFDSLVETKVNQPSSRAKSVNSVNKSKKEVKVSSMVADLLNFE